MWPFGDPLDRTLFHWDRKNRLTIRQLLAGGLHAFGQTSSGKTSSMVQIARAILRYGNSSMLVMCPKPEDPEMWLSLASQCGRLKDVVLIGPQSSARFNMFGYEAARTGPGGGIANNVTRFIMELRSVVFRESQSTGGDSQEWKKQDERLITLLVILLQLADEKVTPANLHELIESAPRDPSQLADKQWQQGFCSRCLERASRRRKSRMEEHDYQRVHSYLVRFWPSLADRTRSSIEAGTTATLAIADVGLCRALFADRTNITPAYAIENRKIVIVSMTPDDFGDIARVANVGFKYHWQRDVLRRRVSSRSPITCIWGDESSLWVTPSDSEYLSRCRSYRGCMVYLCQSLNSYREVLPGPQGDAAVRSMLSNFGHRLFFLLGDCDTAHWASALCGAQLRQFVGGSVQHEPREAFTWMREQARVSSSFQEQYDQLIQPGEFMSGLRTGSPVNGYQVDALLVRSGAPFSNGTPLLRVTFDQRR